MKKILIIEDEGDLRAGTAELLKYEGYDTIEASNGFDGVKIAKTEKPDLILCDIRMPGMSGFKVLEELKKCKSFRSIPFIYITGIEERTTFRYGMELGADDYLTKPFSRRELLMAVSSRLERFSTLEQSVKQALTDTETYLEKELSDLRFRITEQRNFTAEVTANNIELMRKLKEKELELTKEVAHITKANSLIQKLKNMIDNELRNDKLSEEQKRILMNLKIRMKDSSVRPDSLTIFQLKFNQTYPDFTIKFARLFSHLTSYDLVFISAMAAGLNTNQLSNLLSISADSVRKSRYRLKRKMGLGKEDDLLKFIYSFHSFNPMTSE